MTLTSVLKDSSLLAQYMFVYYSIKSYMAIFNPTKYGSSQHILLFNLYNINQHIIIGYVWFMDAFW